MSTGDTSAFDPVNMASDLRSSIRDCIHGRHARKCPECDLVIELRESAESARKLIRLARRAAALWHERPFEDCPLNQLMNMLHVAAADLDEHFPDKPEGSLTETMTTAEYRRQQGLPTAERRARLIVRIGRDGRHAIASLAAELEQPKEPSR